MLKRVAPPEVGDCGEIARRKAENMDWATEPKIKAMQDLSIGLLNPHFTDEETKAQTGERKVPQHLHSRASNVPGDTGDQPSPPGSVISSLVTLLQTLASTP